MDVLRVESLVKSFDGRRKDTVTALGGVSLQIESGCFNVIQGASGSGKTTLLLGAGGLLQPDTGTVHVLGEDLYSMSSETRARFRAANIGFVFQQFHLIPYLTVLENVLAPTLALSGQAVRHRAAELLESFGMSHRLDHAPAELSTGERQRVALARALLNSPALLLADEPTGNLDEKNAAAVLQYLRAFATDGGAVLLATHDSTMPADERFLLADGVLTDGNS